MITSLVLFIIAAEKVRSLRSEKDNRRNSNQDVDAIVAALLSGKNRSKSLFRRTGSSKQSSMRESYSESLVSSSPSSSSLKETSLKGKTPTTTLAKTKPKLQELKDRFAKSLRSNSDEPKWISLFAGNIFLTLVKRQSSLRNSAFEIYLSLVNWASGLMFEANQIGT